MASIPSNPIISHIINSIQRISPRKPACPALVFDFMTYKESAQLNAARHENDNNNNNNRGHFSRLKCAEIPRAFRCLASGQKWDADSTQRSFGQARYTRDIFNNFHIVARIVNEKNISSYSSAVWFLIKRISNLDPWSMIFKPKVLPIAFPRLLLQRRF